MYFRDDLWRYQHDLSRYFRDDLWRYQHDLSRYFRVHLEVPRDCLEVLPG
jgi:hypothetical protein